MSAQNIEESFFDGKLIKENQVQNNPTNRKQTVSRAVNRRGGWLGKVRGYQNGMRKPSETTATAYGYPMKC